MTGVQHENIDYRLYERMKKAVDYFGGINEVEARVAEDLAQKLEESNPTDEDTEDNEGREAV